MTVISPEEKKIFGQARKRWGIEPFFGQIVFGRSDYGGDVIVLDTKQGTPIELSGIYQVRTRYNRKTCVKQRYYMPKDPKSTAQVTRRTVFASAVLAWQALTDEQKQVYRKRAYCKPKSGYNIFLGEYLKAH